MWFEKDGDGLTSADIPTDASSKAFADFRDRAAYVYLMGAYPTHLRTYFTALLSMVSKSVREPSSISRAIGSVRLDNAVVARLALDEHPMVRRVKLMLTEGYRLGHSGAITRRRPYGRIPMRNPLTGASITVQIDGSVKDDRT